jgi:hypothetical protein
MYLFGFFCGQVTNYHVVAKLATDTSGLQRCKVFPYAFNSIKPLILDGSNIFYIEMYTSICRFSLLMPKGIAFLGKGK